MQSLKDLVVLVSGGSRGIGRAITLQAVAGGARVAFCCRSLGRDADDVVREAGAGGRILAVECDIRDPSAVDRLYGLTLERFGRVDVLIANAGISIDDLSMRLSTADWDAVIDTNLMGTVRLARHAVSNMLERRSGSIVLLGSLSMHGAVSQSSYAASKGALVGLCGALAREFGHLGISCNVALPGYVPTAMSDRLPEKMKQKLVSLSPLRRAGRPSEIAAAVLHLARATPERLNGRVLRVTGGLTEVPA